MSQPVDFTDSRIVMAEQSSHDVVNQTLSGGDPSPSDVPASTNDKTPAGGDVGETKNTATSTHTEETNANAEKSGGRMDPTELSGGNDTGKDTRSSSTDISRNGPGSVATRALEMNGVGFSSDGGDDTASQGGSESDASRTDSRHPGRAGSVKKPASFKPVSFAKFSVPKAPGTPAATKPSDKVPLSSTTPLGVPPQSSRPRLVAKTTGSLRDSLSKTGTSAAKPGGSGPDPNQVWNKNRPAQPTPPKHLTDEELKQQYGIHMTSRIQEDGGGTEGKWADIEDDEDDWAPETIEWTDGTKTNLTQSESAQPVGQQPDNPPAPVEPQNVPPPAEQAPAVSETAKFTPKPTTSIGPNPTVLRLGANAERQAKNASISSKGINDKSSASTSPAPPPAKSPWAPLPPVERASPIIHPVQAQPPPRPPVRELPVNDGYSAPLPPKEIEADDFNRSWKEIQSGTPRELYNSRSGRYEPVSETRKGAWRNEQSLRAPSVLQRPMMGEQVGPAEPSPAFQTHRSSGPDGGHWTRRRTSSNVSGGSGSFGRRMSIGRPEVGQRSFETKRGSQVNGIVDPSISSHEMLSSNEASLQEFPPVRQAQGPAWPRRTSVNMNDPISEELVPAPPTGQEDPVAMQERIMKEKRMEARQRRIEQEEKEEAAKRERIRQKLEALGPPPEKSQTHPKDSSESNKPEAPAPTNTAMTSHSPPKPPVPEPTGEPKQYGMMKVHHPDTVRRLVAANERDRAAEKPVPPPRRIPSPSREPQPDAAITNGFQHPAESQTKQVPGKYPEPKVDEQGPQWRNSLNVSSSYSTWSPNTKLVGSSSIANPWKPLSNDRTLGNGIFEQSLGGFPARDLPLRTHLALDQPPIAPGPQAFSAPSRSPQENTTIPTLPSPEVRLAPYDSVSPIVRPGPIGPPSSQQPQWQPESRVTGTAAWNNFHAVAAKREAEESEKLRNEMIRDGPSSLQVTFNETWRQVRTGDQSGQRQVVGISRGEGNAPASNPLTGLDHPASSLPFSESHSRPLGSVPVRSSRFFPHATEHSKKPTAEEGDYVRSPSPPPPEEVSSHPVFTGDSNRPLVHLPAPKPVVKLPPKVVAPPPPPPTFASMAAAPPRPAAQPLSWQEKFNGLFGKKTVPQKKNALEVLPASKEPLDVPLHIAAVSVSLPHNIEGIECIEGSDVHIGDGEVTAKQVEEAEEMFEDREVGSLPVVRVPNMAPPAAWRAAPPPSQSRLRSKNLKPMQVHSIEPYTFGFYDKDASGSIQISIRLPGAIIAKTVILPKKPGIHNPRPRGTSSFKPRKSTKPREGPGSSNTKKQASSQQASAGGSSRSQSKNASWGPRTFSGSR
ncbi:hypothetical protein ASPWEDRAFT_121457 [Aspergillus wentii DTO 134E9]|uniref:PI-PLC Y-box domain-containing protein n=1 Tax=Aspergillus wentii DTO 134E9 TaxID=1073089 RepID=A0A1L9R6V9_ASPWE|nr:uncharacterized protein ASPWEDRAFT_121457 [Aspergillus wentii DTO 134E9]OJJ30650.1 hypothetical protein ASPWEDRAFT_121457 [Aspergillus wentii DTO 134E9]